ncbi:MAG: dimethylargininase [Acidobacteriota bacterium]|nr:dimethylargininase [Acidobacteriota bacterium]
MLTAITRGVSRSIGNCELTWLKREPIDADLAISQHHAYEQALRAAGAWVISLPAIEEHPDAVFVEDPALVLDEVAVMTSMGVESRRGERESLASALGEFRPVIWMRLPGKLEGGDVMRIGHVLYAGLSDRTDEAGVAQLADAVKPFGYRVKPVELRNCLHLKSACTYLGDDTLVANREWFDEAAIDVRRIIHTPETEPGGANALRVGETVVMPSAFPGTAEAVRRAGFRVRELHLSELLKAESGVTCSSLVFET